ncbi:MAG: archaeal heat shock protein Hsp20 [Nitrososphaerales archaeon]
MSSRYPNRRSRRPDDGDRGNFYADPFDFGFRFGFQDIDQMIDGMFKTIESIGENTAQNANTIYYGYQVNVGPDGKPHVREFGNVKPTKRGTFELGSREPFVDTVTDEKEGVLKVVAEMPGVQKQDIKLEVLEDSINIKAESKDRNYDTNVPLDVPVEAGSAKASYNNGILEVKLQMKASPRPKGVNIKVD